ncbi:MAG: TIGR03943 family protein [Oscillatoriophycideae cyanobacterium NC_groundwater_1537_Pr4_S-0.65um_50_18]|nr:TIGR03943 family protein [Oscillatoriophycideae cyanobacterium NC_groundwater_1537_Pr4_S-0.65um_50_18]
MTASAKPQRRPKNSMRFLPLLDIAALLVWGILLLKFWLTGKIAILLHPDYVWLAYSAGFFLVGLAIVKLVQLVQANRSKKQVQKPIALQHFSLFPPGWGSALLLTVGLFGLQFTPQPFSSQAALDRGVTDTLTMTRSQPQAFRGTSQPEKRSLVEWIRTLNIYPEPDAYTGQKVNLSGFAIHPPEMAQSHLAIARFVITCCAADAYPVGLPVKLPQGDRSAYPPDKWFQVEGVMATETLNGKRQLVIQATSLKEIPEPASPYDY